MAARNGCLLVVPRTLHQALRLGAAIGITAIACSFPAVAQTPSCPALAFPPFTGAAWDEDTSYEITVRDLGAGQLRITVVGDILLLDNKQFTSLMRTVDKAPGNVAEVVLDGRVVRLVEPLSLQNGRVRILAQSLVLEGRGLIALTKRPGSESSGLEIYAQTIDLRKALPLPLQISVAPTASRSVVVRAGSLITAGGTLDGDAARRMLWRRSTNFDGGTLSTTPPTWDINVGTTGATKAFEAMAPLAAWPSYLAYKLRKHHAFAPFEDAQKAMVAGRIRDARPVVEAMQRAEVLLDFDALTALMARNLDRRGFGPAHVPSEDLVVAQNRFKASLVAANQQMPRLSALISSAHQAPKVDTVALEQARTRIKTLAEVQAKRHAEIGETFTELASLEARSIEVTKAIEFERENSRKELERLKEKDKDLAAIKVATTVVAVGVSFVGTPAAGAALAAGVGVAGDFVYAHNAGRPVNVETLVTIGQKNADLYKNVHAARASWEKHSSDLDTLKDVFDGKKVTPEGAKKPLTKTDAAKMAGASAGEFAKSVKSAVDGIGSIPKPDSVSLNQVEAENGALQGHLARMADIQRSVSDGMAKLDRLQAALASDEAELAETRLVEQVLLELKPSNDQEIVRWKTAALQLWGRELQSLYQDSMDLRRSLFFETWKTPVLPADVLNYPEEFTAYLAAGRYSPEAPNATSPTALTAAHLNTEIAKHLAVLGAISSSVEQAWQDYLAERAAGAQPFFDQFDFSDRAGAPVPSKLFLEQLNAQIRRQIQFPSSRNGTQFTLLIPFSMTPAPTNLPERLLRAGVANVKVKDSSALVGKTMVFDITHRLAGELRRSDQCSYVDLSVPGGAGTVTRRDQARELSSVRSESEQPMTFESLRLSRAAPPARTLYFLSVTIGGSENDANWRKVPELESFTFWRRIVQ